MSVQHTFKTTNPEHIALYREAEVAYQAHWDRIVAWAESIHPDAIAYGGQRQPQKRQGVSGLVGPKVKIYPDRSYSPTRVDTLDPVPKGWRWTKTRDCYRPAQGKVAEAAKQAILDINSQAVNHPSYVLIDKIGMPNEVWMPGHVYWPGTWFDLDGNIWIYYGTRLDASQGRGTKPEKYLPDVLADGLTEQPLSAWHKAREDWSAAHPEEKTRDEEDD